MVDFVEPTFEDVGQYKVLFVPSLMLLSKRVEEKLRAYVKDGGILIATPRTGAKNWNNNITEETLPGGLSDVFGTTIEEYTGLPGGEKVKLETVEAELGKKTVRECGNWAEVLAPEDARVVAYYQTGNYKGKPAVTSNSFGKGTAIYVGTFAERGFHLDLVDWLIMKGKVEPVLPSVAGFEATERVSSEHRVVFALNHTQNAVSVPCNGTEYRDLLSGDKVKGHIDLGAFDVKVLLKQG
jgi:beta-galactosidase